MDTVPRPLHAFLGGEFDFSWLSRRELVLSCLAGPRRSPLVLEKSRRTERMRRATPKDITRRHEQVADEEGRISVYN